MSVCIHLHTMRCVAQCFITHWKQQQQPEQREARSHTLLPFSLGKKFLYNWLFVWNCGGELLSVSDHRLYGKTLKGNAHTLDHWHVTETLLCWSSALVAGPWVCTLMEVDKGENGDTFNSVNKKNKVQTYKWKHQKRKEINKQYKEEPNISSKMEL